MDLIRIDCGRVSLGVSNETEPFHVGETGLGTPCTGHWLLIVFRHLGNGGTSIEGHWSNSIEFDGQEH